MRTNLLPEFNQHGDLPPGIYGVTLDEAIQRLGSGSPQRETVTDRLRLIYNLARSTGAVQKFLVFGSYVTDKTAPNDVDVVLIMQNEFSVADCTEEAK